ncbi:MAG: serine/threonine-protein kinase [Candidatus Margulisbacteria bacterium]|nr:serine/threonine-protein kinase [Candidatus Margulisiibacteriota bacterium]
MEQILKSRYRITDKISENPFSVTYKGTLLGSSKPIVIKIYKRGTLNSSLIRVMKQKVKDLTLINYHGIAKLLDGDYGWQGFYYIREYVEGKSLEDLQNSGEKMSEEKIVLIIEESCRALEFAHSRGIIHGALKPGNIIIDVQGVVRLTDFVVEGEIKEAIPQKVLTILDNAHYTSPEELLGRPAAVSSDIYSLGQILGELLVKKPLLSNDSIRNNLTKLKSNTILATGLIDSLPRYLQDILNKCLRYDPLQRFSSIAELRESLEKKTLVYKEPLNDELSSLFDSTVTQYGEGDSLPDAAALEEIGPTRLKWGKEKHRQWILLFVLIAAVIAGIFSAFLFGR